MIGHVATIEGRHLFTKLSAGDFDSSKSDATRDRKAILGSARLRDAILMAKGIIPPPTERLPPPRPTAREIAHIPEPCPMCGAPAKPKTLISHIQRTVAAYFEIPHETMTSAQQYARVARPRQIAIYLSSELTPHSVSEIGRRFKRDHTTAMHAIKAVKARMIVDAEVLLDVEVLRERLSG